jgi:hypothetical protein
MLSGIGSHSSQLRLDTSTCALRYSTQQTKKVLVTKSILDGFEYPIHGLNAGVGLGGDGSPQLGGPTSLALADQREQLVSGLGVVGEVPFNALARPPWIARATVLRDWHLEQRAISDRKLRPRAPASHVAKHLLQLVGTPARRLRGLDPIRVERRRNRSLGTALSVTLTAYPGLIVYGSVVPLLSGSVDQVAPSLLSL